MYFARSMTVHGGVKSACISGMPAGDVNTTEAWICKYLCSRHTISPESGLGEKLSSCYFARGLLLERHLQSSLLLLHMAR